MKKIWKFLLNHIRTDFHAGQYAATVLLLAVCIVLNYSVDFEDRYLEYLGGFTKYFAYFIFYSIPYFGAIFIFAFFKKRLSIFSDKLFWTKSLFGVAILALDASLPYLDDVLNYLSNPRIQYWLYKVVMNGISFVTVFIPILIFYYAYDKHEGHRYGLSSQQFDARPYFIMLLIMLPLVIAASYNPAFIRQYPMYKVTGAHLHLGVDEWVTVAIYEIAYGLDFITVEYFFRGFLVLAMAQFLGRSAVITMAVIYCVLHFGKPAGEAMSSIFGGYILGVVAYETKSVWGGIIVHMG
ncbi:MAG TPA: CPBP family intramembrane glutamic endopeptidase, partial [Chryseosolibacter sp.]